MKVTVTTSTRVHRPGLLTVLLCVGVAAMCFPVPVRERVHPTVSGSVSGPDGRPAAGVPLALSTAWQDTTCSAVGARTQTAPDGSFTFPARRRWGVWIFAVPIEARVQWRVCARRGSTAGGADPERSLVPVYSAFGFGRAPVADAVACTIRARTDSAPAESWHCERIGIAFKR